MGVFFCLIFGVLSFAFNAVVAITVKGEGGFRTEEKSSGAKWVRYISGLEFEDWLRVDILAAISALIGLLMYSAQFWAITGFIVASAQVIYITYWAVKMASEVRETISFLLDALIHYLISTIGVEAARAYKLRPIPGIVFIACVAIIISTTLFYRANKADENGEEHGSKLRFLAIAVIVIAVIVEVTIIYGMIKPAAH